MLNYILNELSLQEYPDERTANERMRQFVNTCAEAQKLGFTTLRIPLVLGNNLYSIFIAPNYPISQWLATNEHEVIAERFKALVTQSPLFPTTAIEKKELFEYSTYQVLYSGQKDTNEAEGLGAAHVLDTLAVSFTCRLAACSCWNHNTISLNRLYLDEEAIEKEEVVQVIHAATTAHVQTHLEWLQARKKLEANTCEKIWTERETLFPHLIFCGKTEMQLKRGGIVGISKLYEKLERLNEFADEWKKKGGGFSVQEVVSFGLNASNESESTMQNSRWRKEREFRLPDKKKVVFEPHIKAGASRFHFYADEIAQQIYIGYIGKHLPTKKFN